MSTDTKVVKKRRGTSLPLLIGFLILGVVGYFAGPTIMKWGFYLQESIIAGSGLKGSDVPEGLTPDTSGDPNVGPGPGANGPGGGAPGAENTAPSDAVDTPSDGKNALSGDAPDDATAK